MTPDHLQNSSSRKQAWCIAHTLAGPEFLHQNMRHESETDVGFMIIRRRKRKYFTLVHPFPVLLRSGNRKRKVCAPCTPATLSILVPVGQRILQTVYTITNRPPYHFCFYFPIQRTRLPNSKLLNKHFVPTCATWGYTVAH